VKTGTPDAVQCGIENMLLALFSAQAGLRALGGLCNRVTHLLREFLATIGI
jgi:hypothetical protein